MGRKYIDLTGQTTEGGIYVKCIDPSSGGSGKHKRWVCLCPVCGEEFVTQSNHLIGDKIESCSNCSRKKYDDLTGRTFGYLTVERRLYEFNNVMYLCKCTCGNYHIASTGHLNSGTVKSCGCLKSLYESTIKRILQANNICFETEKRFEECHDIYKLPFDFYIPELNLLIEMQGQQHYMPVKFWGAEDGLKNRQRHDQIKKEFCEKEGYNLLVINYNEDIEKRVNEEIVYPLRKQAA